MMVVVNGDQQSDLGSALLVGMMNDAIGNCHCAEKTAWNGSCESGVGHHFLAGTIPRLTPENTLVKPWSTAHHFPHT